jgi:hypothetical protein
MATPIIKEQDPEVLAALPLDQLNHEIGRCLWGYENGGTSQGRKSFFKRLVVLEGVREGSWHPGKAASFPDKVRLDS